MRQDIKQVILSHRDYILFLREHPEWHIELESRPENFKQFYDKYKEERKLTLSDQIEKIGLMLNMLEILK